MKLSARNVLAGKVIEVKRGATTAHVRIQIHGGAGVSNDFPLAYWYAMQRTLRLADGPDEVHRAAVGKFEVGKYVPREAMKASR